MNILIDYETYGQTAQMTHDFFRQLTEKYDCKLRAKNTYSIKAADIEWADIVLAIRPMNSISQWIAEECKNKAKLHISMFDDNLLNHLRKDRYMKKRQQYMIETIKCSKVLLTTNELLSTYLSKYNPEIRTSHIDTVVDIKEIKPLCECVKNSSGLKLVYYSNDGTTNYFESFMPKVIKTITERLPQEHISIDLLGIEKTDFDMGNCECAFIPHMGYSDFKKFLKEGEYIAGISPIIADDDFSKYKYFNKFIEYTIAGIVGIYSDAEPYVYEVTNGINGFLCVSIEEWVDCICKLYNNPSLRIEMIKNAYKTIEQKHSFENVAKKILEDIPELLNQSHTHEKVANMNFVRVRYRMFWLSEKINATYRYLQKGGIRSFANRTKGYINTMSQISNERNKVR